MSRACSHPSRRFFHGSLVGFTVAQNWNSRSLRSATNRQSCVASVPAAPGSLRSIAYSGSGFTVWPRCLNIIGVGEAGHRGPVAPTRLAALLALALKSGLPSVDREIRDL